MTALPSLKDIHFRDAINDTRTDLPALWPNLSFLRSFTFSTINDDEEIRAGCADKWRFYRSEKYRIVTLERIEGNVWIPIYSHDELQQIYAQIFKKKSFFYLIYVRVNWEMKLWYSLSRIKVCYLKQSRKLNLIFWLIKLILLHVSISL